MESEKTAYVTEGEVYLGISRSIAELSNEAVLDSPESVIDYFLDNISYDLSTLDGGSQAQRKRDLKNIVAEAIETGESHTFTLESYNGEEEIEVSINDSYATLMIGSREPILYEVFELYSDMPQQQFVLGFDVKNSIQLSEIDDVETLDEAMLAAAREADKSDNNDYKVWSIVNIDIEKKDAAIVQRLDNHAWNKPRESKEFAWRRDNGGVKSGEGYKKYLMKHDPEYTKNADTIERGA